MGKNWTHIYGITAFIGIVSAIWGHQIYLLTVINSLWLIFISLIPSIILFLVIRKHYLSVHDTRKNLWPFLNSLFSVGFLVTSLLLIMNYKFASPEVKTMTFDIHESGKLGGRARKPYVIIQYGKSTKKLVFKNNSSIEPTNRIRLVTSEGLFGFEVILSQEIIK